jgi:hypothetical protein
MAPLSFRTRFKSQQAAVSPRPISSRKNFTNQAITSLAMKALVSLTFFSLLSDACAQQFPLNKNPCEAVNMTSLTSKDWLMGVSTCPPIELQLPASATCLKAIEIFKMKEVQTALTRGLEFQPAILNTLSHSDFTPLTTLLEDTQIEQEISKFPKDIYPELNKGDLIISYTKNEIELNNILINRKPDLSFLTQIFQSHKGLNLAKPGDKDITLYVRSDSAVDHNGAFGWQSFRAYHLKFLQEISQIHPIYFIEASSDQELLNKAEEAKRKIGNIKIFIINGHANENSLSLGETTGITASFSSSLPIDADGALILNGCSTGKDRLANLGNLVNRFACKHPGVAVMGLLEPSAFSLHIENLEQRKFSFRHPLQNFYSKGQQVCLNDKSLVPCEIPNLTYRAKASLKKVLSPFSWLPLFNQMECQIEEF